MILEEKIKKIIKDLTELENAIEKRGDNTLLYQYDKGQCAVLQLCIGLLEDAVKQSEREEK